MDDNSKATSKLGLQVARLELENRNIRAEIARERKMAKATRKKEQAENKFNKLQAQDNYDNIEIVLGEQQRHSKNLTELESANAVMENKLADLRTTVDKAVDETLEWMETYDEKQR